LFHAALWPHSRSPQEPVLLSAFENRILVGDNLEWLKILREQGERFDFVYTDPPYNTGQPLTYRDRHHSEENGVGGTSAWLSMIFPRFHSLHELLAPQGVLFVSIDDREVATLRMILDEIFGRDNFIGTLKWKKKRKPSFLDRHIGITVEYILIYAKDAACFPRLLGDTAEETTRPVLNASNAVSERLLPRGFRAHCADGIYPAGNYVNRTLAVEFLDDVLVKDGVVVQEARVRGRFRVSQEILGAQGFITAKLGMRRVVNETELTRRHASDLCADWPTNEDAEAELRALFGSRVFDYPKPVGLMTRLLDMYAPTHAKNLRCLDLFAGSGSLGTALLEQNSRYGSSHAFSLIQTAEPIRNPVNGWNTISDLLIARIEKGLEATKSRATTGVFTLTPKR
jgi:16S rRNA G966 N2-methylase RsmD